MTGDSADNDRTWGVGGWYIHPNCTVNGVNSGTVTHSIHYHDKGPVTVMHEKHTTLTTNLPRGRIAPDTEGEGR